MRCRRCGAENAAHMRSCGNCGFSLGLSATYTDEAQERPPETVVEPEPRPVQLPPQDTETPPALKTQNTISIIAGTTLLLMSVLGIIVSSSDDGNIPIEDILPALFGALLLAVAVYGMRRGQRVTPFIWQAGDPLEPLTEARGAPATFLFVVLVAIIVPAASVLIYEDIPLLVPIGIGAMLSVVILAGLFRTKIFIQADSIVVGIPTGLMMAKLPFEKLDSANLRGRMLKVVLAEKPTPMSPKTRSFLILGNPRHIATAIQAVGTARGASTNVENVDIDPELLKTFMAAIHHKGSSVRTDFKGRYVLDESDIVTNRTHSPEMISGLLAGAGVMAIFTAFIFVMLDGAVVRAYDVHATPLECCGTLEVIFAVVIFAGAFAALRRKRLNLVRISAVVAIISIGGIVSIALGIMALILLRKCADEFT